jgi:hypothetical protein
MKEIEMSLKDYSEEQLLEELNKRKKVKSDAPSLVAPELRDYSNLEETCKSYVEEGGLNEDTQHYIFEEAMMALYVEIYLIV